MPTLLRKAIAEAVGTFLLVLFGTGCVASAITTGAQQGIWQVAAVWGFGIALSIFATAGVSGAHLNPAVTFALAIWRPSDMQWRSVPAYVGGQLTGAIAAGAAVLAVWSASFEAFEAAEGIDRDGADGMRTGAAFGEYFPNPGSPSHITGSVVSPAGALAVEALGTAILMFMILALTDERNPARPAPGMVPFFIGFTVAVLISLLAPLTQAGFNPARDFGPRVVAALAGWGAVAFGPSYGFWVYIVGPLVGAPLGAGAYDLLIRPGLPPLRGAPDDATSLPPVVAGSWCADQVLLQRLVRDACSESCCDPRTRGPCEPLGKKEEEVRLAVLASTSTAR